MRFPNGYGSICKLSGKRRKPYMVQIQTDKDEFGKRTRKPLSYHKTRAEAFEALKKYNEKPYDFTKKKLTFADVYKLWHGPHCSGKSDSLNYVYTAAFKSFSDIHDSLFEDLRPYHYEPIIQAVVGSKQKKMHMTTLLGQLYKYAKKYEVYDRDYSKDLIVGAIEEPEARTVFSDLEIKKLSKMTGLIPDSLLIMIYTGFRISELLAIETANINLDDPMIKGGLKSEAGKNRVVPIHPSILPIVKRYYNQNNMYLFDLGFNQPVKYSIYLKEFRSFMTAVNMDHIPHEARHTFITNLDRVGAKDNLIKLLVGHAQTDFTKKVYTHNTVDQLKETIALLSGF